jgi:uncharacterized protein
MAKHILITGASGLIGTRLTELLLNKGYSVTHLGRSRKEGRVKSFVWNVDRFAIEPGALHGITTIIHLAGAGVVDKRWTASRKEEIFSSRIQSTALLHEELKKVHHHVTSFISASAIGYYGFLNAEKTFTEETAPGHDFLADVTRTWEEKVDRISDLGIRVCKMRIGIVLSEKGGALKQMVTPIKLYAGAPLGSGNQQVSWIHLDDLCGMFIKAIEDDELSGAYNATGSYSVSNKELTEAIANVLHKPLILPNIPKFVLKVLLGEMADIVVNGSSVSSKKIQQAGFQLKFKDLTVALKDLLQKG